MKPVTLYLEDIQEILDKLDICEEIELSDDDYEYDSLDELKERKGKKLKTLNINGHRPYIHVDIRKHDVRLYLDSSSTNAIARFFYLKDFLSHKSSWYTKIFNYFVWYIITLVYLFTAMSVLAYFKIPFTNPFFLIITGIIILSDILSAYLYFQGSSIHLESKNLVESFFSRNSDAIILVIIGAILGGFITMMGNLLIKFF